MKYAEEVISLISAYPGRDFKIKTIINYVCPEPKNLAEMRAVRKGVFRVLAELANTGSVLVKPPSARRGGYALYQWKRVTHA